MVLAEGHVSPTPPGGGGGVVGQHIDKCIYTNSLPKIMIDDKLLTKN